MLHDLIGQASKNKSFVNQRNSQALLVHGYLEKNLLYAKDICNHDGDMIDLSGFDRNYLPENAKTPEKPVIKKVGKGKEVDTYKVILVKKQIKPMEGVDPVTHQKGVKFTIELSVTPEEVESWKEIGRDLASTKLVILVLHQISLFFQPQNQAQVHQFAPQQHQAQYQSHANRS